MNYDARELYRKYRRPHWGLYVGTGQVSYYMAPATVWEQCKREARIRNEWQTLEDEKVRLVVESDDSGLTFDDITGDTFNPDVNPDVPAHIMERQRQEEIDRINRDGITCVIGQYYNGESWVTVDSVGGFVGDDWKDSGYDLDIMESTLEAFHNLKTCPCCGRPLPVD